MLAAVPIFAAIVGIGAANARDDAAASRTLKILSDSHVGYQHRETLVVDGLSRGILTGRDLRFSVAGAPPFDRRASSATIFIPGTGKIVDVAGSWQLDSATNVLTVPAAKVATIMAAMPAGAVELDVGLVSKDGEFAFTWSFPIRVDKGSRR